MEGGLTSMAAIADVLAISDHKAEEVDPMARHPQGLSPLQLNLELIGRRPLGQLRALPNVALVHLQGRKAARQAKS